MKAVFALLRGFIQSRGTLFLVRRAESTKALIFDPITLLGIIPTMGLGIIWFLYQADLAEVATPFSTSFCIFSGLVAVLASIPLFVLNVITITSRKVEAKTGSWLLFPRRKPTFAFSGGVFCVPSGTKAEISYNDLEQRLLVPISFYSFYAQRTCAILNDEIRRVSGGALPRAEVKL